MAAWQQVLSFTSFGFLKRDDMCLYRLQPILDEGLLWANATDAIEGGVRSSLQQQRIGGRFQPQQEKLNIKFALL